MPFTIRLSRTNHGQRNVVRLSVLAHWVLNLASRRIEMVDLPTDTACTKDEEPCTDAYGLELLHQAIVQGDQKARVWVHCCFGRVVLDWLQRHPKKAHACRLEREEHYVALTFERFWQANTSNQRVKCITLADALVSLRASLNSVILDRLRANARPRERLKPMSREPVEAHVEIVAFSSAVWEMIKALLA